MTTFPRAHPSADVSQKNPGRPAERRQILFVAVQVSQNVAAGPAQAPIDSVIHALVFFNESSDALVLEQPIERPIVRARILDMCSTSTCWSATEAIQSFSQAELR